MATTVGPPPPPVVAIRGSAAGPRDRVTLHHHGATRPGVTLLPSGRKHLGNVGRPPSVLAHRAGRIAATPHPQLYCAGASDALVVAFRGGMPATVQRKDQVACGVAACLKDATFPGLVSFGEHAQMLDDKAAHANPMRSCTAGRPRADTAGPAP